MWKDGERAKKRQKITTGGPPREKAATGVAAAAGEEAIKEEEIWDKEVLDALFNKTVQYSVINSYVSAITKLYAW